MNSAKIGAEQIHYLTILEKNKKFPYEIKEKKNWSCISHNKEHINEIARIFETVIDIVNEPLLRMWRKIRVKGKPNPFYGYNRVILMKGYFGMPNLIAEGLLKLL